MAASFWMGRLQPLLVKEPETRQIFKNNHYHCINLSNENHHPEIGEWFLMAEEIKKSNNQKENEHEENEPFERIDADGTDAARQLFEGQPGN